MNELLALIAVIELGIIASHLGKIAKELRMNSWANIRRRK